MTTQTTTPRRAGGTRTPLLALAVAAAFTGCVASRHGLPHYAATDEPAAQSLPGAVVAPALRSLSVGASHGCGLTDDGSAYCWGSNAFGQLGAGAETAESTHPVRVAGELRFTQVSAGAAHSCGVATTGEIYCWGLASDGQLGVPLDGTLCDGFACSRRPIRVATGRRFEQVSAGYQHSCALSQGAAFCWGRNVRGELGVATTTNACGGIPCSVVPVAVETERSFSTISARGEHSCALSDGVAYCWGDNRDGQLGIGTGAELVVRPTAVVGSRRFVEVAAGGRHSCGLTDRGSVYCWGSNRDGAVGVAFAGTSSTPQLVSADARFAAITTSGAHSCAVARDGTAYCWGLDRSRQLGRRPADARRDGDARARRSSPAPVAGLRGVTSLSAGGAATCAVTVDGTRCWGESAAAPVVARWSDPSPR